MEFNKAEILALLSISSDAHIRHAEAGEKEGYLRIVHRGRFVFLLLSASRFPQHFYTRMANDIDYAR
jgi:hypothetical protein